VPWINIAVGILTIISPFVTTPTTGAARWAMVIPGIVIAIVAIIEMSVYAKSQSMSYWPVVNILAGIWLFIATTFAQGNTGMIWSNVVLGVSAIVTALVALSYERVHASAPHTAQRA
jgi:uncharacterized membrane protein